MDGIEEFAYNVFQLELWNFDQDFIIVFKWVIYSKNVWQGKKQ